MSQTCADGNNRRFKAFLFLAFCGLAGSFPHWIESTKNLIPAIILAFFLGGYGLRVVLRDRDKSFQKSEISNLGFDLDSLPCVDVVVAARDEENVVEQLVSRITSLNYPQDRIKYWIVDDGSQDNTFNLLEKITKDINNINLLRRPRNAGGGKSGALNFALGQSSGEWLLILDADAQLQEDLLIRAILFAQKSDWSAIQLRKAVVNANQNFLTCFQSMEMAMDAAIQRGRLQGAGVVELRGNGQLIQREALENCGLFNENTVTDDLDLSFRLLINGLSIGILWDPPIQEEAVTSLSGLIKQRERWAEGGLQRFFDYWKELISPKINSSKKLDLASFFLLQYAIPLISCADILTSFLTNSLPVYWPLSFVALSVSGLAYWKGCSRKSEGPEIPSPKPIRLIMAIIYLLHWFIVIPLVTFKMAILQKQLIWVKTIHKGNS